ncbi:MAG: dephospho-CoA kinase [Gammaproteobacteria bacterium]|nr:dephospho-CoA kinase [Gammaproteobacteria bacterium]
MLKVGLTGGIGSGKSTVSGYFRELGVPVIDADEIGHELSRQGNAGYNAIISEFGDSILEKSGQLDRAHLRRLVFTQPVQRKRLEAVLHPLIRDEILRQVSMSSDSPYCIIVVPLLVETDFHNLVDRIAVIDTTEKNQIERVMQRNRLAREQVEQIIAAQAAGSKRLRHADDIIRNNGGPEILFRQVQALHQNYLALAESVAD